MTKWRSWRAAMLAALLGLSGCAGYSGPVFGDWRGNQPMSLALYPTYVDLVLYGAPGATQGMYDFQAMLTDPTLTSTGDRTVTWGDRWTLARTPQSGSVPVLTLHNLPGAQISRYALLPNGLLVPLTKAGAPDVTRYSLSYALRPVPRTDRRFGRL